jgi:hypothetical protein
VRKLSHHTAPLADLESRHGTSVVTGNHEYYSGVQGWVRELERLGARVLMNEHVVLDHDGAPLTVAGVTDYSAHYFDATHRSDPQSALAGSPADVVRVMLAHQPRSARASAAAGAHVQLSGHTAALHRRPAPRRRHVGVHQSRHRLLGPADALRRAAGDHGDQAGENWIPAFAAMTQRGPQGARNPRRPEKVAVPTAHRNNVPAPTAALTPWISWSLGSPC